MTPARLHQLYDSYFGRAKKPEQENKQKNPRSLAAYLKGGG